jgi:hypothetical protein
MARTTTVHLLTGDYPDRLDAARRAAEAAGKDEAPRAMLEADPYEVLVGEYEALKAEALEAGTTVNLAAVGRKTWRALKEKHPPRFGEDIDKEVADGDRLAGVNTIAVEDDLVYESIRAWQVETSETDPRVSSRSAFDEWADTLSEGEWQVLVIKAWELANGARLDPKDHLPSRTRSDG